MLTYEGTEYEEQLKRVQKRQQDDLSRVDECCWRAAQNGYAEDIQFLKRISELTDAAKKAKAVAYMDNMDIACADFEDACNEQKIEEAKATKYWEEIGA